jgi:hypothetical protein
VLGKLGARVDVAAAGTHKIVGDWLVVGSLVSSPRNATTVTVILSVPGGPPHVARNSSGKSTRVVPAGNSITRVSTPHVIVTRYPSSLGESAHVA